MPWIELLAWVAGFVVEEQDSARSMGGFLYVWSADGHRGRRLGVYISRLVH